MIPGPALTIIAMLVIIAVLIYLAIVRWIYRINERLYWLKQIHQKLDEISLKIK